MSQMPKDTSIKQQVVAFHGGRSWEYSGIASNFDKRRQELVIADVLDAPFPPSPKAVESLSTTDWDSLCRESPPTNAEPLIEAVSSARNILKTHLVVSSGSSSLLFSILPRLLPAKNARVLLLQPTYSEYPHIFEHVIECAVMDTVYVDPAQSFEDGRNVMTEITAKVVTGVYDGVFLVNPNSPTGTAFQRKDLEQLARTMASQTPQTILWMDECYIDYVVDAPGVGSMECALPMNRNLFICKSLSKCLALSGLRVAYLAGQRCSELRRWIPPWSVSLPGQVAAISALQDSKYYKEQYHRVARARNQLVDSLRSTGLEVSNGVANFICVNRRTQMDAAKVSRRT